MTYYSYGLPHILSYQYIYCYNKINKGLPKIGAYYFFIYTQYLCSAGIYATYSGLIHQTYKGKRI